MSPAQRAQFSYAQAVESTQAGRSVQALAQAKEALASDPNHTSARYLAAVLLHEAGRTEQAIELLKVGIALSPSRDEMLGLLLAQLQAHGGQSEAALETVERLQLTSPTAQALRAGLANQLHRYKQAVEAYQAALQQQPGQVTWWLGLGVALEGDGQTATARQAFARAQAMGLPDPELSAFVAQRLKALD